MTKDRLRDREEAALQVIARSKPNLRNRIAEGNIEKIVVELAVEETTSGSSEKTDELKKKGYRRPECVVFGGATI